MNEDHDFLVWLRNVEKRAILPLKWAILATALVFWMLSHPGYALPPDDVFILFTLYLAYNMGESYFFWLRRVTLSQVYRVCVASYVVDVVFVTLLVYFDVRKYTGVSGSSSEFYILYFLLILRGFALFRTPRANLLANGIIGILFILTIFWQDTELPTYSSRVGLVRAVFVWLVILMSWFIVEIINRQKAEIMRARERLIQSENMTVLGEIAAGVAHEINNPIAVISAYAEFLKKNAAPDDPRREDFQTIYKEARRCERIVAQLLDYARPVERTVTLVDLRALNEEMLDFLFMRGEATSNIKIVREYPDQLPLVAIDANQMKQALLNIYLNAREAMPKESPVLRIKIEQDLEKNTVVQRVEDNGCGMDPDQVKRAFDPFFTTRPKGTGLGLAITRRIVEGNGGKVSIRSQKEKGTTVKVTIPYERTRFE